MQRWRSRAKLELGWVRKKQQHFFHFVRLTSFSQNGFFCSRSPERMELKMLPDGEDDDRCHIRRKFSRFPSLESYWIFRHLLTSRRQMGLGWIHHTDREIYVALLGEWKM
ncbi:hypothetical protein AVEN_251707-1 [Araneus ventricosus]|uniref:Uncharacterized protein n=1 Tax=Araneus ventricosus TaxID=182803 RepID=A0A4Y2NDX7_ARAVE|nr:hypothetical protein AVEN_251707-1 [Araneus ventricosus]